MGLVNCGPVGGNVCSPTYNDAPPSIETSYVYDEIEMPAGTDGAVNAIRTPSSMNETELILGVDVSAGPAVFHADHVPYHWKFPSTAEMRYEHCTEPSAVGQKS